MADFGTHGEMTWGGAAKKRAAARKKKATGGGAARPHLSRRRIQIFETLADQFAQARRAAVMQKDPAADPIAPYLVKAYALLSCLENCAAANDDPDLRQAASDTLRVVLPLLDPNPMVSLYIMLQPYRPVTDGPGTLICERLVSYWDGRDAVPDANGRVDAAAGYLSFLDRPARFGADHALVEHAVNDLRDTVEAALPKDSIATITAAYDNLQKMNAIGGVRNVFPAETAEVLRADENKGMLLWMDSFRLTVGASFDALCRCVFTQSAWQDFRRLVDSIYYDWSGTDYRRELTFMCPARISADVGTKFDLLEVYKWMNSSAFMSTPIPVAAFGGPSGSLDPRDDALYNRNGWVLERICKVSPDTCMKYAETLKAVSLAEQHRRDAAKARGM